jgi:amino acid adenylation domain-containing protein
MSAEPVTIQRLFEDQAERTPAGVALSFGGRSLTYAELNARANRLAHHLRAQGVRPEVPVAVCLERSLDTVVAPLAVLKAGGAYVPLDPRLPARRRLDILDDTEAHLLVVRREGEIPAGYRGEPLSLEEVEPTLASTNATNPVRLTHARNLLNIVYTSSSTGRPKGVLVEIGAVVNRLRWMWRAYPFVDGDVAVLHKSLSLVASACEVFGPLLRGVPTVVIDDETLLDPALLWRTLVDNRVSVLLATPSLLEGLLQQAEQRPGEWQGLRLGTTSAEPVPPTMVERWTRAFPGVPLLNLFGATECSSNATFHDARDTPAGAVRVPIGRPLDNVQVHVLDADLRAVPPGTPGELCVSGACLARGYLNRPDLTSLRFVPNPFAGPGHERLYRTGDVALVRPDGSLELIGRKDDQVKVRGFRVELGDVEAALGAHPGVRRCAVAPVEGAPGGLAAYVVPRERVDRLELVAFLRERLPEYMVPATVVLVDALPTTPSGKVARRALPPPEPAPASGDGPLGVEEEAVARIWSSLLGRGRMGRDEDFFAAGGHSLLAMRAAARMTEALGVEVPVRALFEGRTVAATVRALSYGEHGAGGVDGGGAAIVPRPAGDGVPLTPGQRRLWFLDRLNPGRAFHNLPFAYRLGGRLDVEALGNALAQVVGRHEALRTRFPTRAGEPAAVVDPVPRVPLSVIDLDRSGAMDEVQALDRLLAVEAARPFDVEVGPLVRAVLVRLAPDEHAFVVTVHHLVFDGWSRGVFFRELAAAYAVHAGVARPPLPDVPLQARDVAAWWTARLERNAASTLDRWTARLAGADPYLEWPGARLPARPGAGARHAFRLAGPEVDRLPVVAAEAGVTPFAVLLTAFAVLVGARCGQTDFVIGTPVAHRGRRQLEEVVGFLVSTLPVRIALEGGARFVDLVRSQGRAVAEAVSDDEAPIERMAAELKVPRIPGRSPLFQTLFVLVEDSWRGFDLPGVEARPLEVHTGEAPFELALTARPVGGALEAALEHRLDLFSPEDAERLAASYARLVRDATAEPHRPWPDLAESAGVGGVDGGPRPPATPVRDARRRLVRSGGGV